jgi:hypothetical protein
MPLPLTSDLAVIMSLEEFAVSAQYQRKSGLGDTVINIIFDNETVPVDAGGFATVHQEQPRVTCRTFATVHQEQPRVTCRTSDVPEIAETDVMIIGETNYMVRAWVNDGTGVTEVRLEKQ